MATVGAFEAKTHFSALLEKAEAGECTTITRHGRPVARLVPVEPVQERERMLEAIRNLESFADRHRLDGLAWEDLRDEGRR